MTSRLSKLTAIGISVGVNVADLIPYRRMPRTRTLYDLTRIERAEQNRERKAKRRMKP